MKITQRTQADRVAAAMKLAKRAADMAYDGVGEISKGNAAHGSSIAKTAGALALVSIAESLAAIAAADYRDVFGDEMPAPSRPRPEEVTE